VKRGCWQVLPKISEEQLYQITHKAKIPISPLIVQLLYNRDIRTNESIESFLAVDERLQNDPFLLPDIDDAVERIRIALIRGKDSRIWRF